MSEAKKKITAEFILRRVGYGILILYAAILIFGKAIFKDTSDFYRSFNIFSGASNPNTLIRTISYVVFVLGVSYLSRLLLKNSAKLLKKGRAMIDLLCSLIKYTAAIVLVFYVLKTLGVDTTALLAGVGILGLVVGLGAQPLIADIIAGLFIVFEKVFDVGDIVVVDGFRGTVKEIGVRTTQIMDAGGNVKIINNSDLRTVINMTEQLSLACCDLSIEYGESLERVEAILKDNLDSIRENIPDIKEGPFYKGVAELADSAVIIKFVAKCEEGAKYQVERDMNRQFKLLFDKYNINIPFPQIVLNKPAAFEDATAKQRRDAEKFVEEQKELGKKIPEAERNDL